jgi:predicted anti-sigma-YlaC factor YlaD
MSCKEVRELMQRYLDHDLNEMEQQTMVSHFSRCPECSVFFERLQQVAEGLEALPDVRPPFSLVDSILPRLDETLPERPILTPVSADKPEAGRRKERRRFVSRLIYGGTAACALFLGVFLFQTLDHGLGTGAKNNAGGVPTATSAPVVPEQQTVIPSPGSTTESASPRNAGTGAGGGGESRSGRKHRRSELAAFNTEIGGEFFGAGEE